MKTKLDRAREITRAILHKKQTLLRSYTNDINVPQRVELRLGNGEAITFQFTNLADIFSILDADAVKIGDGGEWTSLDIRIDGYVKLRLRYCGPELDLVQYLPGQWERRFGVDPGRDVEMLLPPALRAGTSAGPRSGLPQH